MDAKRDGVVFTPRFGKPVEISALWYAALMMLEAALEKDQPKTARELAQLASKTAKGFEQFWDASRGCLFDCLVAAGASWTGSAEMRPNQLFAVSLPYSALSRERQKGVVSACERDLLTPFGLRTLAAGSPKYRPRFEGPLFERDGAYHNGTVWPWLLGPFCEAYLRVSDFSGDAKRRVRGWLTPLIDETLATATTARAGVVPRPGGLMGAWRRHGARRNCCGCCNSRLKPSTLAAWLHSDLRHLASPSLRSSRDLRCSMVR
jgi:glycogen debranching enzyme